MSLYCHKTHWNYNFHIRQQCTLGDNRMFISSIHCPNARADRLSVNINIIIMQYCRVYRNAVVITS